MMANEAGATFAQLYGFGGGGGGSMMGAMGASDRRLKKNIKLIGKSPNGLNIYLFEYINKMFGEGVFQGVMSDEMLSSVVIKNKDVYNMVDYSNIDIKFKSIKNKKIYI